MTKIIKFILIAAGIVWLGMTYQDNNFNFHFDFWMVLLPVTYLISLVFLLWSR